MPVCEMKQILEMCMWKKGQCFSPSCIWKSHMWVFRCVGWHLSSYSITEFGKEMSLSDINRLMCFSLAMGRRIFAWLWTCLGKKPPQWLWIVWEPWEPFESPNKLTASIEEFNVNLQPSVANLMFLGTLQRLSITVLGKRVRDEKVLHLMEWVEWEGEGEGESGESEWQLRNSMFVSILLG